MFSFRYELFCTSYNRRRLLHCVPYKSIPMSLPICNRSAQLPRVWHTRLIVALLRLVIPLSLPVYYQSTVYPCAKPVCSNVERSVVSKYFCCFEFGLTVWLKHCQRQRNDFAAAQILKKSRYLLENKFFPL